MTTEVNLGANAGTPDTEPDFGARARRWSAATIVSGLAVCGAVLGMVWAGVAPPIHTITALTRTGERADAFLGREADNIFVAAVMMIGLVSGLAVVAAVAVWQWRTHRGPLQVTALWIGMIAAGGAAAGVGAALAHARYGTADHAGTHVTPTDRVHYFTEAPPVFLSHGPMQVAVTLLLPAALAALVYSVLAVANPRDDLDATPEQMERPYDLQAGR